jgi:proteic killer suppression protein
LSGNWITERIITENRLEAKKKRIESAFPVGVSVVVDGYTGCRYVAGIAILSFKDSGTQDIYNGVSSKAARRFNRALWTRMAAKPDSLNAATTLNDLKSPGKQLEKLTGTLAGYWSIRVNIQYRICFRFDSGNATDVFCEDIH